MKPTGKKLAAKAADGADATTPEVVSAALVARFRRDLAVLWPDGFGRVRPWLALAVSGGPDSLALLLLAAQALSGRVSAATIDHGLRPESGDEARAVAEICETLNIPHKIISVEIELGNLQEQARIARYDALAAWMGENGLDTLATAHHADDQAETFLMRLNRGSGLAGLAGVRAATRMPGHSHGLVRPLLAWRKDELEQIVADAGLVAADDPSNRELRFDRVRIRSVLREADWLDSKAISRSAANLGEAEEALQWAALGEWENGVQANGEDKSAGFYYRPRAPKAIRLLVIARIIAALGGSARGSAIAELDAALVAGGKGNLGGVLAEARPRRSGDDQAIIGEWQFAQEPRRR